MNKETVIVIGQEAENERGKLHKIIDSIGDILFVMDENRVIFEVNKSGCDLFRKKPEELIGKHCYEVVHGTNCPWPDCPATKTFEKKQVITKEVNDPNLGIPLLVTTSPILDDFGNVIQVIHVAKDISSIKLAETEMHIAANLFDVVSDSILVSDLNGKIVFFNEAAYKTRGFTRNEFQTLSLQDLEVPDNPRFFGNRLKDLFEKGEVTFEGVNLRKDKTVLPVEIHARVFESNGQKLVLSVARDISERKAIEEALFENHEKYKTSFDSSMDALMLLDEKSFLDCNSMALMLFGFSSVEEFNKNHTGDLSPTFQPDGLSSHESAIDHINKAFRNGWESFFWVYKRTDGAIFQADVLLSRISLKHRNILQATVRDVSQQKEAEQQLKMAEEKYRTLLNTANVIVQSVNAEGKYIFVNEEWKKTMGYSDGELEDVSMANVVRKDHLQYCMQVFMQVMNGACIQDIETVFVAKDGHEITVSGNACPILKDGKFISTVSFFVDVTEHKKNEEKLSEDSRRIASMNEKLRVVGSLTRHDVRNKLSAITGYSYILKKKHADQADIVEALDKMVQAVNSSVKIFDFAKLYEQLGVEELSIIEVKNAVDQALALFTDPLKFQVINECNGLNLLADSFLRQMFYNLMDNTRKYGKKATTARIHYESAPDCTTKLIYEDDGVGISKENKRHLFKEGFSTGGSTGFGLFLIKKMMEVYCWTIEEIGEEGKGVKFKITIPKP